MADTNVRMVLALTDKASSGLRGILSSSNAGKALRAAPADSAPAATRRAFRSGRSWRG